MKIEIRNLKNGIKIIDLGGEIDIYSSINLKIKVIDLIDLGNYKIIINMEDITYIDSSGLNVLITIYKRIKKEKGEFRIVNISPEIKRVLGMTRLDKSFDIYEDEESAIKELL